MRDATKKLDNPMAVIGALAKAMYESYGDEVLPVFESVLREYGYQRGLALRRKLDDKNFVDRIEAWMAPAFEAGGGKTVEKTLNSITVKGSACPFNLHGCGRDLCIALMGFDQGFASALADHEVTLEIATSLAGGDEDCLVTWSVP